MKVRIYFFLFILFTSFILKGQGIVFSKVIGDSSMIVVGNSVCKAYNDGYMIAGDSGSVPSIIYVDSIGNPVWRHSYLFSAFTSGSFNHIIQTKDSSFVVIGYNWDSTNPGIICMKINQSGDTLWSKMMGSLYGVPYYVQQTFDHGFIITGTSDALGSSSSRLTVIKLDSLGNQQWNNEYTIGMTSNTGRSVHQTPDSGYVIGVSIMEASPSFSQKAAILKLNNTGGASWVKTYGISPSQNSMYSDIVILTDGYLSYIIIDSYSYLVKTDFSGNIIWSQAFGPFYEQFTNSIFPKLHSVSDGGYVVVNSTSDAGIACQLYKFDSTGTNLWARSLSLYSPEAIEANDSGIFILGNGPLMAKSPHGPGTWSSQIGIIKTDSLGHEPYCVHDDISFTNFDTIITTTVSATINASGTFFPTYPLITTTTLPVYMGCVNSGGGIKEFESVNDIMVSPNPFTNQTTITFEQQHSNCTLKIIDILGKEVYKTIIPESTTNFTINKGNLNPGIYFIQVQSDKGTISKKIIIQ